MVYVIASWEVTFKVNAPEGVSAEIFETEASVEGVESVTETLAFDEGVTSHALVTDDFPFSVENKTEGSDYFFAGWTTSSDASYGSTVDQLVGTVISADTVYYAVWKQPTGYWLGSAKADEKYVDEAYFAANDPNYHSSVEIAADKAVLQKDTNSDYETVKAKWDSFYENADSDEAGVGNQVRLYATYEGGETEKSYNNGDASDLNKYVEFRILEVSGANGHLNIEGVPTSTDGSVVTFMATHVLPTAYEMDELNTKYGGWEKEQLRVELQKEKGSIFKKFSSSFTDDITEVKKRNHIGGGSSDPAEVGTETTDAFWLLSYSELYFKGDYSTSAPTCEGTTYQLCKDKEINVTSANSVLTLKTRAGATPGSSDIVDSWWLRSPKVNDLQYFLGTTPEGTPWGSTNPSNKRGVAPCFCF